MAIQKIERYGKFQPSPINESRVRRMEQLAGFAGGIAQTARAFGEARAAEEAPEKAQAAVEEAIKTDPETGEVTFGDLKEAKGYGASATNQLALSIYDSSKSIYLDEKLDEYEQLHPNDLQQFTEKSQALLQEITANSSLETRTKLLKEYSAKFKTSSKNIQKTIDDEVKEAGKASYVTLKDQFTKELIKAYQNDDEELQQILKQNFALTMKPFIENDIITQDKIIQDTLDLENKKNITTFRAKINQIVDDKDLDIDERTQAFNEVEDKLSEIIKDYSVEDQETARKYLKTSRADAFSRDKRRLEELKIASFKEQIENYEEVSSYIEDDTKSTEEKLFFINQKEFEGLLNTERASIARRYVTSEKALNAITDNKIYGDIIDRIYSLNADLSLSGQNADYLEGLANIDSYIKTERANGKLNRNDEVKLRREMKNLTAAKKAEALSTLSVSYYKANNIIKESVSPELRNVVRARLFERVQSETQKLEEEGKTVSRSEISGFWQKYALSTATEVKEEEKEKARENITNTLNKNIKQNYNVIRFDASGNRMP
jgi:hypothetical protein